MSHASKIIHKPDDLNDRYVSEPTRVGIISRSPTIRKNDTNVFANAFATNLRGWWEVEMKNKEKKNRQKFAIWQKEQEEKKHPPQVKRSLPTSHRKVKK